MNKFQAIREHIALREQFWNIHYNPIKRAYGFFRCYLHRQELIEAASAGIRRNIEEHGTVEGLREKIGDRRKPSAWTMFTTKGWIQLPFVLAIRLPFAVLALVGVLLTTAGEFLEDFGGKIMKRMPKPEANPKYAEETNRYYHKKAVEEFTRGSQIRG